MKHISTANGECLCGKVKFTAKLPSKWVAHCHCTRCQRAHGAAFVTWVGMESANVSIHDSENCLHWHVSQNGGDRAFCRHCGSSIFFKADQWPDELHIALALFVDPIDREPQAHVYYDTHVSWVTVSDQLPTKPDPGTSF